MSDEIKTPGDVLSLPWAAKEKEHEYAFDVKLYAVVRVKATSEADARAAMDDVLAAMDLSEYTIDGMNSTYDEEGREVKITEASLTTEDGEPLLFELDGEEVE